MKTLISKFVVGSLLMLTLNVFALAQMSSNTAPAQKPAADDMVLVVPGTKQVLTSSDRGTQRIAREVRHELAMLTNYTIFDDLRFKVEGYTVTLGGSAISLGLKRDAENAVKGIEGVEKVVNNIRELSPSPSDQRIREAVARRIFSFGPLSRYAWEAAAPIHIIVDGGHVTLAGVVDSESDKNAAGIRASGTSGVFSVTNNLQVAQVAQK
jgi:hyperosmotically inducible protein